jgi:glycosyltransferase involved in cell wall biosynthesis
VKVLLSAFACESGRGSELEAGYRTLLAAAREHEVWVLTVAESVEPLRAALREHPRRHSIHIEGIEWGQDRPGGSGRLGFVLDYDRWQRAAAHRARLLDREARFDLVHHVTVSSYWTRVGVGSLGKPLVWGPVGGGVEPPSRMLPVFGLRGAIGAAARFLGRPIVATLPPIRRSHGGVDVLLVQNAGTARRIRKAADVRVLPHSLGVEVGDSLGVAERATEIVFAGRLVAWKGPMLALASLRQLSHPTAVLRFCGIGPERTRLERAARRWDLTDRVRFEGYVPRADLLERIHLAGVVVHPALHEEGGMAVAEALALGTPVVCLDHGGPAEVARRWPDAPSRLVQATTPCETATRIATAIDDFLSSPPPVPSLPVRPSVSFEEELLDAYAAALSGRDG